MMSTPNTSNQQKFDAARASQPLTIANVRPRLSALDLAPGRMKKMQTALSTAARVLAPLLHRSVAEQQVIFDCATLRRLREGPAATLGLSSSRRTSLISELVFIAREFGVHEPNTQNAPLQSSKLKTLHDLLPIGQQLASIDFFRYLDRSRYEPEAVTSDTLRAYGAEKRDRTLCPDPGRRMKQSAAAWNWGRMHMPGWPAVTVSASEPVERFMLPSTAYPREFQNDLHRHLELLEGFHCENIFSEDIFAEDAETDQPGWRALRPASIHNRLNLIRCAGAALVRSGIPIESIRSLRDLVEPLERPRAIISFYLRRSEGEKTAIVHKVADTLRLIGRDYCRLPAGDVEKLTTWAKRMRKRKTKGMTEKNRRRVRALMATPVRAMLLHLPAQLMKDAANIEAAHPEAAARLVMYAVALEILLICPMRRGNLAALRMDQHLHRPDPRKPMISHIFLREEEVKNKQALQWPVPPESARLIATYLSRYRQHLASPDNPFLFPVGSRGRSANTMAIWLSNAVARYIGVEFNLHLVRHFSAWNHLRQNPGEYELVRCALGHSNIQTTRDFYLGLETEQAAEHFDRSVLHDRQATRRIARQAFRAGRGGLAFRGKATRR